MDLRKNEIEEFTDHFRVLMKFRTKTCFLIDTLSDKIDEVDAEPVVKTKKKEKIKKQNKSAANVKSNATLNDDY